MNHPHHQGSQAAAPAWRMALAMLLCAAGLTISVELAVLHFRVHTDPNYHSFCAVSQSFNCETVAESPYSVFLGLPLAFWGILGYLAMFAAAGLAVWKRSSAARVALLLMAAFSTVISLALALLSYCVICAFCLLCSITYLINLALLILAVWEVRRLRLSLMAGVHEICSVARALWHYAMLAVAAVAFLAFMFPPYWHTSVRPDKTEHQGETPEGLHWIGAAAPQLVITEFSDYLCPHCRRGHANMRRIIAEHPGRLQLVHRHFPLDDECNRAITRPFHVGACLLARAAYCAGRQGKFWEMNDLLYQYETLPGDDWAQRAKQAATAVKLDERAFAQCLDAEAARGAVHQDVDAGAALGVTGTPSFVVGGKVYPGEVPAAVLSGEALKKQ